MDYLRDEELEKLGLIKEIDTLDIINKSNEMREIKNKRLMIIGFIAMMISGIMGQILFIKITGGLAFIKIGLGVYVLASILVLLILIEKGDQSLC